jgi:N-acyl-D-aspartate/D-glutamate deacylase
MMAPDGVYVTHVRYALGTLEGVKEAVEIGRRAGVPVHISHLKATTPAETEAILTYIDTVALNEVDFSFDVYPYLPSSTMLQYLLPYDAWLDGPIAAPHKLTDPHLRRSFNRTLADTPLNEVTIAWVGSKGNSRHQGKTLARYINEVGGSPADVLCDLLIEEGMAVLLVFHLGDDDQVAPFLAHPSYMMGSDGIYQPDGHIHPRQYGSAARLLGRYAREQKLFSLESAVRKMSGFPAERFGLRHRGLIQEGYFADLVVFDAEQMIDEATYEEPHQLATGVKELLVNGRPVIENGQPVDDFSGPSPGRYLQRFS